MTILVALLLSATPPVTAASPPQPTAEEDQRLVCKYDAKTGTRFKTKTCKTVAEWRAIREQNIRDAREVIDRPQLETRRGG